MTPLRTVVAYPGVMAAATEVARGLLEADMLARYETTLVYAKTARLDRAASAALRLVFGARSDRQLARRALELIPAHLIHREPWLELVRVSAAAAGADDVLLDRIWSQMITRFDAGVARRLDRSIDLVYGYEHGCHDTFQRAATLGIGRVFDMAAPHYSFWHAVASDEVAKQPEVATKHWLATEPLSVVRDARKQAEFDMADLIIANSNFTARTLTDTGYPAAKVRVVPLGAPPVDPGWRQQRVGAVRFLFAGSFSLRKGAHHLLAAWRALGAHHAAELVIAGEWALPDALKANLPASIRLLGRIPRDELFAWYRNSSVLVFPTLCDGFGMVVTEALAHGLPVITTRSAGASDLIEEGENGWIVTAGSVDALAERIDSCLCHPEALHAMREAATRTAAANQWSDYRRRLVTTLDEFFRPRPTCEPAQARTSR